MPPPTEWNPADQRIADQRIVVVGGCGRVGLPLGVKMALAGFRTSLLDINENAVQTVKGGHFPFLEENGERDLAKALAAGLAVTTDRSVCREANVFIFVTGTPVDEYLNPKFSEIIKVLGEYRGYLDPGNLVIMRSTLCPGMTEYLQRLFRSWGNDVQLSYCPERVAQGFGLSEIESLPQIVSAFDEPSFARSCAIFSRIAPSLIRLTPEEAEVTKLIANSWRYLEFAIANQFYTMVEKNGLDFSRIYQAIRFDYPRAATYRSPGLAAGPCLFKDTMQLASWARHDFDLGHAAVHVNEGLADFMVDKAEAALGGSVHGRTVGILGLAFKADCDDTRTSLSFRVRKVLDFRGAKVLSHDPYVPGSPPLDSVIASSEALVLCTPHREYRELDVKKPLIDVWGLLRRSPLEVLPGTRKAPR
jgi:UDP-N-acetyl-D-mannosaminuronic acid dehydrogenase